MKKFILFFILMFVVSSTTAFAEGEYDGIWFSPIGYISMHESNGMLGFILLEIGDDQTMWSVSAGALDGNEASMRSIPVTSQDPTILFDLVFDSDTNVTAIIKRCTPEALCEKINFLIDQLGGIVQGEKIW